MSACYNADSVDLCLAAHRQNIRRQEMVMVQLPSLLALDIGTSSVRAFLYGVDGAPVSDVRAQRAYMLTTSHEGEVSVDADHLVDLVALTLDEVLERAGERAGQIVGVATSAFWHSLVPLDTGERPLMPLLTWEDTRPQQAALDLRASLDEQTFYQRTGARLHTSYWPAKLAWLAGVHPEIAQRAARYVSFSDYLYTRLLGRSCCSLSMASGTGLLNIHTRSWDADLLAALHVSLTQLSELCDLADARRGLTPTFAARWPALRDVPWFPAIGDGAAANIGSGCTDLSTWAVTIGTSSAMRVLAPPERVVPQRGLWLYLVDRHRAVLGGALSEGGNILAWLQHTLQLPDLAALDAQIAGLPPAGHGLTILPMLAGERGPGWHTHAGMTISGLTLHTTPAEIALAALESIVFQLSRIYNQLVSALADRVPQPRLIASGSALLKSAALPHLLADTLNCPLEISNVRESSARGAALLALEALGRVPDLARLSPGTTTVMQPDPVRHTIYAQARERQQRFYDLLLP